MIIRYISLFATLFLLVLCFFINGGFVTYATIAIIISLLLFTAAMCGFYAKRCKEVLFCPKCGSENIVKKGFLGIPISITDTCPDCHKKININRSVYED